MGTDKGPGLEQASEGATFCQRHPDTETYLRCSRCGAPICPRCLVQTPVGARCPDCVVRARIPSLELTIWDWLKGFGAAAVAGAAVGAVWALIMMELFRPGIFLTFGAGLGIGWLISEAISLATKGKRGPALQGAAVYGAIVAFFVRNVVLGADLLGRGDEFGYIAVIIAALFGASRLKFWS